ncbi:SRPBCC family protein [Thalassococcus lentus]|uniref:SRPBCC family protein n=1 Tax=Thalassococcus lentus TaxID=1210524 RepID=A0ABT4XX14_9RHOB|nr:SRPBCC family protein [Thalassococcus lentus]MDA7426510.1 SRPBCC family protein [Thalassococcus lentus]
MHLTAKEDIEAPMDKVFAALTDFETIERQALRRGVEVRRTDSIAEVAPGMSWNTRFKFRGKSRDADIKLRECYEPERLVFHTKVGGLEAETRIEMVALSRARTRVNIDSELQPKTLSARLLVQSLKLAKGGIDKRFRKRIALFAKDLENRLRAQG